MAQDIESIQSQSLLPNKTIHRQHDGNTEFHQLNSNADLLPSELRLMDFL